MFGTLNKTKEISVIEAHSVWSLISAKYHMQDNIQFWLNHVHDEDLRKIINSFIKDLDEHIKLLEKELKKYSIEAPSRAKKQTRADVKSEIITDELIGINYFTFLQGMVQQVLFAIQNSVFNDDINNFLEKFAKHAIEQTDSILKYLKLKGWIDIPPSYTSLPAAINEKLDCIEAFHLWAHTYYRYGNMEETLKWKEFVHDLDFKMILDKGSKRMEKQIALLENELEYFGLPTPKKPPAVVKTNQDKTIFQDESIYKTLYIGLQWAGVLHANAFTQCVTNDRIRNIFKNLLYDEIKMVKQMSKYGKLKGWLEMPPEYIG
jgi:spore coat protein CotF